MIDNKIIKLIIIIVNIIIIISNSWEQSCTLEEIAVEDDIL